METVSTCPLCGGPNQCGNALGKSACWCYSTVIPDEVLAKIPEDQRDVACVCARCAAAQDIPPASS
ncbi:MAG: cysteine-rich CWC family protein [Acidobacteriota bacterium]